MRYIAYWIIVLVSCADPILDLCEGKVSYVLMALRNWQEKVRPFHASCTYAFVCTPEKGLQVFHLLSNLEQVSWLANYM